MNEMKTISTTIMRKGSSSMMILDTCLPYRTYCTRFEATHGIPRTPYRPRVRPKGLVMPIQRPFDRQSSHDRGHPEAVSAAKMRSARRKTQVLRRAAIFNMENAPEARAARMDRTVGDVYEFCLSAVLEPKYYDVPVGFELARRRGALQTKPAPQEGCLEENSTTTLQSGDSPLCLSSSTLNENMRTPLLALLHRMPIAHAALGHCALFGRSFITRLFLMDLQNRVPRIRAHFLHEALARVIGLQATSQLSTKIGFASATALTVEVKLWTELNHLTTRKELLEHLLARDEARLASQISHTERITRRQRQLREVTRHLLRRFPATQSELEPVITWISHHMFAFVAFVHTTRGEDEAAYLTRRLLYPDLMGWVSKSQDVHPLQLQKSIRAEAKASTLGNYTAEELQDAEDDYALEVGDDRHLSRRSGLPLRFLKMLSPANALKELQFLVQYAPDVPSSWLEEADSCNTSGLRRPLHFQEAYRTVRTEQETTPGFRSADSRSDSFRNEVIGVHVTAGRQGRVVGVGEGYSLQDAMNKAALQMVRRYYLGEA